MTSYAIMWLIASAQRRLNLEPCVKGNVCCEALVVGSQLLQSKAFNCAYVFLSSKVNFSPALTRQDTVLPISASLYSKPLGNAMRALCSSPVLGFLMGSVSDSAIPGIRIVAYRFSRFTLRVMGAKSASIRLGQTAAKISQYVPDQRLPLFLADLFVDNRAP